MGKPSKPVIDPAKMRDDYTHRMSKKPKCELVATGSDWTITVDGVPVAERLASAKVWSIKKGRHDVRSNGLHETKVYFDGKCIGTAKITTAFKRGRRA